MATHETLSRQAVASLAAVDRHAVMAAFVASLSSRNLPARSAFGSYVVLQHFAHHDYRASQAFSSGNCAHCGLPQETDTLETDARVSGYPFQVQHTDISYAAHDLATFNDRRVDVPSDEDRKRLAAIFHALSSLPATAQLGELNRSLQGILKSNKRERMILLETFGYAGILCPPDQRHYSDDFVSYDFANLNQPQPFYKREWAYPVRFWTGADGVSADWFRHYFSAFLA